MTGDEPLWRRVLPLRLSAGMSSTADGMVKSAAPVLAASLTSDPRAVATVTMAALAAWFTGLLSGALTDRLSRRTVLIWTDVVRASCLVVFTVLTVTDRAGVAIVAIVAFLMTSGTAFYDASGQAILPRLVGREVATLSRQNGRLHMVETTGRSLVGIPLGPATFASAAALPFALAAILHTGAAQAVRRLPRAAGEPDVTHRRSLRREIWAGLVYLVRDRSMLAMSLYTGALNFADAVAMAVFVLFARVELGVSDAAYGLLLLGLAVGNVLGGGLAGWLARCHWAAIMLTSAVVHALGWAVIVLVGSPWLAGAMLLFMGVGQTVVTVSIVSTRQAMVPDHLLGRVIAGFRVVGNGSAVLGAATGGFVAAAFGLSAAPWTAAGVLIVTALPLLWIVVRRHGT
ncbi:MFS transporter [Actinophytocola sp.]|uniref:MFS transporter n=1 Tax=Actinophytocola sp. TaxID=1872138 RepID=UPI002ED2C1ED